MNFPRIRRWSRLCGESQWAGEVVDHGEYGVEFRLLINRHLVVSRRFDTREEALLESAHVCELCTSGRDGKRESSLPEVLAIAADEDAS